MAHPRGALLSSRARERRRHAAAVVAFAVTAALALFAVVQVVRTWQTRRQLVRRALDEHLLASARVVGAEIKRLGQERHWMLLAPVLHRPAHALAEAGALAAFTAHVNGVLDGADFRDDPYRGVFRLALHAGPAQQHAYDRATGALEDATLRAAVLAVVRERLARPDALPGRPLAEWVEIRGRQAANVVFARVPATAGTPALVVGVTYGRAGVVRHAVEEARRRLPPLPAAVAVAASTRTAPSGPTGMAPVASADRVAPASPHTLGVRFLSARDEVFYSTPDWPAGRWQTPYRASTRYATRTGGFVIETAMDAAAADRLVGQAVPPDERWCLSTVAALVTFATAAGVASLRRVRELALLRSRFVASVSHELRTPLTQICLLSDTLVAGSHRSDAQARRWLAAINRESHRLATMVESVLVTARDEADRLQVSPREADAAEIARDTTAAMRPIAAARGSALRVIAPGAGCPARVDPGAFRQVLLNLLDNAVKYGRDEQTITVTVRPPAADGVLVVTVDDEGRGVPATERLRVWRPYERLDVHDGAAGGSGLGLSVVRTLVALHGGTATVEDAPTGGARFRVTFPGQQPVVSDPCDIGPARLPERHVAERRSRGPARRALG